MPTKTRSRLEAIDAFWMMKAMDLAMTGKERFGDRPFGCIIVDPGRHTQSHHAARVLGCGWGTETGWDPTRHCEITAIRMACTAEQRAHLDGSVLYSTHEPCVMCCGAIIHAQVARVVWGSARSDLPDLFHQRRHCAEALLADTSDGRISTGRALVAECIRLFNHERPVQVGSTPRVP